MTIELFVFPPTPRAFKVMVVANYLGLDWTERYVDLLRGDQRAPEFAALNPNMRIPTLRHGETVLWESNAIVQYLALQRPQAGLLPLEELARLDVTRWQFWDLAHLDPACVPYMRENVVKKLVAAQAPDADALAQAEEPFHRTLTVLDHHLRGRDFVSGGRLTLADFCLGSAFIHAGAANFPLAQYGEVRRWYASLAALPAWRQTLDGAAITPARAAA